MRQPYQKKIGEFEIRILSDGRVVFVAPDDAMMDVIQKLKDAPVLGGSEEETSADAKRQEC